MNEDDRRTIIPDSFQTSFYPDIIQTSDPDYDGVDFDDPGYDGVE